MGKGERGREEGRKDGQAWPILKEEVINKTRPRDDPHVEIIQQQL
jgi:hypothetical protein